MTYQELLAKAAAGVTIEGDTYYSYSANVEFPNGAVLFCSYRYRAGKGRTLEFNYAAPGEKYFKAKRITKARAMELLK